MKYKEIYTRILMITIKVIMMILLATSTFAQEGNLLVYRDEGKIYLRWPVQVEQPPFGYNVYARGGSDESWRLLTPQPLRMAFEAAAIRQRVGHRTPLFLSLFGVDDPNGNIGVQQYQQFMSNPTAISMMEMMTLVNPELGHALGVIYIDSNLRNTPGVQYRITSVMRQDEQLLAESGTMEVMENDAIPRVTGFEGEGRNMSAILRWDKDKDAISKGEVVTYRLYRSDSLLGEYEQVNLTGIVPVTVSSGEIVSREDIIEYQDKYLVNGRKYYYYVRSVNAFGLEGPASTVIEITPADHRMPPAPYDLRAEKFGTGIRISWNHRSDEVKGFELYKSGERKGEFQRIYPKADILLDTVKWYDDLEVNEGSHNYYFLKSVSQAGIRSPASDTLFYYLEDNTPPSPPGQVSAIGEKGRVILFWAPSPEPDVIGYEVERSSDDAYRSRFLLTNTILLDTILVDSLPAMSERLYGYVVYALDASNNRSKPSGMVKARMPDQSPPLAPVINGLEKKGNIVALRWTPRNEPDLAGYKVYRSLSTPDAFTDLDISFENQYLDTLQGSGKYYYSVSALDSSGNESERSAYLSLDYDEYEKPMPPAGGEVKEEKGALRVDWQPVDRPGTAGYIVTREDLETGSKLDVSQVRAEASSYFDRFADPGKKYRYYVRTYDTRWRQSEPLILNYEP